MAAMTAIHQVAAVGRDVLTREKKSPATQDEPASSAAAATTTTQAAEKPAEEVEKQKQQDRELVVDATSKDDQPMPPSEIVKDPAEKAVGRMSRGLRLNDFELIRTLGTGTSSIAMAIRHGVHTRLERSCMLYE